MQIGTLWTSIFALRRKKVTKLDSFYDLFCIFPVLSVRRKGTGRNAEYPSESARISRGWTDPGNRLKTPAQLEEEDDDILVFLEAKNVNKLDMGDLVSSSVMSIVGSSNFGRVKVHFSSTAEMREKDEHCRVWDSTGLKWSRSLCRTLNVNETSVTCVCNKFSRYAVFSSSSSSSSVSAAQSPVATSASSSSEVTDEHSAAALTASIVIASVVGSIIVVIALGFAVALFRKKSRFAKYAHKPLASNSNCFKSSEETDDNAAAADERYEDLRFQGHILRSSPHESPTFRRPTDLQLSMTNTRANNMVPLRPLISPLQPQMRHDGLRTLQPNNNGPNSWRAQSQQPNHQFLTTRNKWQGPTSYIGTGRRPVATPERPLLTDFPSPGQMSMNHIYMEVDTDNEPAQPLWSNLQQQQQHPRRGQSASIQRVQRGHKQQQQQNQNGLDSCTSSQSSGYGSSNATLGAALRRQNGVNHNHTHHHRPPVFTVQGRQRKRFEFRSQENVLYEPEITLEDSEII